MSANVSAETRRKVAKALEDAAVRVRPLVERELRGERWPAKEPA